MTLIEERKSAIHMLRAGQRVKAVADEIGRTPRWVRKWRKRYQAEGWDGLKERSRKPQHFARQTAEAHKQAIRKARSELEAEAAEGKGLKYIGGQAIRTRLKEKKIQPLPSIPTIERVIRVAGMTRPYQRPEPPKIHYPHLQVKEPQTLIQADIVPHYLKGGDRVACFNAIDVASRYPTGQACAQRRSLDAETFLIHVWQELGVSKYTQVDNEGCFSGGFTHPYVLGKVVRLALQAGTELVFSPVRHPQSNGFVERFHQDYDKHVWQDTYLSNIPEVQEQGQRFFSLYRQRPHSRLKEQTPSAVHHRPVRSPNGLQPLTTKRPLYEGQVHFMRKVLADKTISILNVFWSVPTANLDQGVWATLLIKKSGAKLIVFDAAPDAPARKRLASHAFKLSEPVLAHPVQPSRRSTSLFSLAFRFVARASAHFPGGTMS
ncbi:MAG: DDE-type integrase/transposase/recombinase [Anaerolineae bacterium]|jgi:transposase|nr:DDE-type integrase/transposase/recombinase [Anaerolineae bacterium]